MFFRCAFRSAFVFKGFPPKAGVKPNIPCRVFELKSTGFELLLLDIEPCEPLRRKVG